MILFSLIALTLLTYGLGFFLGRWSAPKERELSDWPCCLRALEHLSEEHRRG